MLGECRNSGSRSMSFVITSAIASNSDKTVAVRRPTICRLSIRSHFQTAFHLNINHLQGNESINTIRLYNSACTLTNYIQNRRVHEVSPAAGLQVVVHTMDHTAGMYHGKPTDTHPYRFPAAPYEVVMVDHPPFHLAFSSSQLVLISVRHRVLPHPIFPSL